MMTHFQADIRSEVGKLEGVILHTPGSEVENMTPENAERALYSDILNLTVARKEYTQLNSVLKKLSRVFQVRDLLTETLEIPEARVFLLNGICGVTADCSLTDELSVLKSAELAKLLIEGVLVNKNNLSRYLSEERFELRPLHNFFFTRDASITIGNEILIGNMANAVRVRESQIMEAIFRYHPELKTPVIRPLKTHPGLKNIRIEGGDIQVVSEDVLLSGVGARTSAEGVDFIIDHYKNRKIKKHIIVQELPSPPESFIHLDMVFTLLSNEECLVYKPLILEPNKYQTIDIEIDNGKVKISHAKDLVNALSKRGIDLKPISCGGKADHYTQEREQWHSGANFFTFAPGKAMGYSRNVHTLEELNNQGFEILKAKDVISGKIHPDENNKCIVTIDGSELARGGGGARCMTMPLRRS
jgi:arginine deiminase